MDRNEVSADDAAALFQKWGKPDVAILDQYNYSRAWKTAMDLFQPLNARDEKEVRQIQRSSLFLSIQKPGTIRCGSGAVVRGMR